MMDLTMDAFDMALLLLLLQLLQVQVDQMQARLFLSYS